MRSRKGLGNAAEPGADCLHRQAQKRGRTAAKPTAIRKAGQCGRKRRTATITPIASAATVTAAMLTDGSASPSAWSLGMKGPAPCL